jgi:hypothetical protein
VLLKHIPDTTNPLNAKLNPICHLLALLGAHHILHISRIRVNTDRQDEKSVKQFRRTEHTYYTLSALHITQRKGLQYYKQNLAKKITIAAA